MNTTRRYGLIAGLVWANLPFIMYYNHYNTIPTAYYFNLAAVLIFAFFILIGILQRKKELGGYLDIREGMRTGLGITIISAIIYAPATFIYLKMVDHGQATQRIPSLKEELIRQGLSPEQIQEKIDSYVSSYPFTTATVNLSMLIFLGGIISIIISMILRKLPKE
jgi:hypothetical protein